MAQFGESGGDFADGILEPGQQRFLQAFLTARTVAEAAESVQISRRTAHRWLAEPTLQHALRQVQATLLEQVTRRLRL